MTQNIKIWEILKEKELEEIAHSKLNLEEKLEGWIENDVSIVADDLLIIGRQVETDFSGVIDLLCLDSNGDVVVIELKRNKTPRDITAQLLDYASWVKDLSNERISDLANKYLKENGPIEKAYKDKFGSEIPEILNENHKMLIVASEIDSNSERIIEYLSDSYGVGINAVTFQYYEDKKNGKKFLSRVFLVEPDEANYRIQSKSSSKRKPAKTFEEFEKIAQKNGVEDIYEIVMHGIKVPDHFDRVARGISSISFIGLKEGKTKSGNKTSQTIFNIFPSNSNIEKGLCYGIYLDRFAEYLHLSKNKVQNLFPVYVKEGNNEIVGEYGGGYFQNKEQAVKFIEEFNKIKRKNS
jgi:hypothetical protein